MKTNQPVRLTLSLPAHPSFLHVATDFAGTSAAAYGLGKEECLKLALAVEEIFMHLSKTIGPEQLVEIRSLHGIYYARVQFLFSASRFNMAGLNMATDISSALSSQGESGMEEMGLMLASRSVDHLNISIEKDGRICLSITKEKAYPEAAEPVDSEKYKVRRDGAGPAGTGDEIVVGPSDPEHVKALAVAVSSGKLPFVPPFFRFPGKVVDMAASGKYQAITALNKRNEMIGGALFRFLSDKIVEIYGPYVFGSSGEAAGRILENCIGRIARTKALGLLSLSGLPPGVRDDFESLGRIEYFTAEGARIERPVFYRLLHEDPGFETWTHSDLASWLRNEYDRLVLARDIRIVQTMGETRSGSSLFASEINREISEVVLRPVWPGEDLDANVERHVSFLRKEHVLNIFFELDVGVPWHSELMPSLAAHGFKPRLLLPFAGKSDVIVFRYDATES